MPRLPSLLLALSALPVLLPIPGANALYWLSQRASTIGIVDPPLSTASAPGAGLGRASDFADSTTSAIFPPPGALETESALDSFFPEATEVGLVGTTPNTCWSLPHYRVPDCYTLWMRVLTPMLKFDLL